MTRSYDTFGTTMTPGKKRPGWFERNQRKLYEQVQEKPEAKERLKKSWFGRLILRTLERQQDEWEPAIEETESILKRTRAERISWSNQITPGWLILTDKRVSFQPIMELHWAPWTIRSSDMSRAGLKVKSGVFLSREIPLKPFFASGTLPGFTARGQSESQAGSTSVVAAGGKPARMGAQAGQLAGSQIELNC